MQPYCNYEENVEMPTDAGPYFIDLLNQPVADFSLG